MPTTRIPIDGLWRCLCPSIDLIGASLRPRNATRLPHLPPRRLKPSRSFHTSPIARNEGFTISHDLSIKFPGKRTSHQRYFKPKHQYAAPTKPYYEIRELTIPEIHEELRALVTQANSYSQICALVEHLIKERGEEPGLFHYDCLIRANADAENGSAVVVKLLLREMEEAGVKGDSRLFHGVLMALAIHPDYVLRAEIMQEMKERWFGLSPEGWHNLVIGLLRDRQLETAMDRLEQMRNDGVVVRSWLYDIFLWQLCEFEEFEEAYKMLWYRCNIHEDDGKVQQAMFYILLDAFARGYHYDGVKYIWMKRVLNSRLTPSDGTCTAILNIAARNADPDFATAVVRMLASRAALTPSHYEGLIEAYVSRSAPGDLKTAFRILTIMAKAGHQPDESHTRHLYLLLKKGSQIREEAWNLLVELKEAEHDIPLSAVHVIIEAAMVSRSMDQGIEIYKKLHHIIPSGPSVQTFNTLFRGMKRGAKPHAMFLAAEMGALNITPDELTYDRLIQVCLHEDDFSDALLYLEEMTREGEGRNGGRGWWLKNGTASKLVSRLVEIGDEKAWEILREMERRDMQVTNLKIWVLENWKGKIPEEARVDEGEQKLSTWAYA